MSRKSVQADVKRKCDMLSSANSAGSQNANRVRWLSGSFLFGPASNISHTEAYFLSRWMYLYTKKIFLTG